MSEMSGHDRFNTDTLPTPGRLLREIWKAAGWGSTEDAMWEAIAEQFMEETGHVHIFEQDSNWRKPDLCYACGRRRAVE